jgi:myo-inositol-1(or 4)-monophosphatase
MELEGARCSGGGRDGASVGVTVATETADANVADISLFREVEACAGKWATEAGELLAQRARDLLHIEYKGGGRNNPVSEADREAEDYLYHQVMRHFPDHRVIGEEGRDPGPEGAPIVWVIDPLDGTTNYLNGLSLWCVSIGVLWHGVPVAGAIWTPLGLGEEPALFSARRNGAARVNGHPMHVDPERELRPSRLAALSGQYQEQIVRRGEARGRTEVRTLGSIALELALTSCGALQFSTFWNPRIWDVVAGVCLCAEAGGQTVRRAPGSSDWPPLRAFEAPPGLGLRKWNGAILTANPSLAGDLGGRVQAGQEPFGNARPPVQDKQVYEF